MYTVAYIYILVSHSLFLFLSQQALVSFVCTVYIRYVYVSLTSLFREKKRQKDGFSLYTSVYKQDVYSIYTVCVRLFDVSFV